MRFGFLETMTNPAFIGPLAIAAEEAGYDSFVVPDCICYPEHSDSQNLDEKLTNLRQYSDTVISKCG